MSSEEVRIKNRLVRESQLDFLEELHEQGMEMSFEQIQILKKGGRIKDVLPKKSKKEPLSTNYTGVKSEKAQRADNYVDVVYETDEGTGLSGEGEIVMTDKTFNELMNKSLFSYQGGRKITKEDWKPKDIIYHTKDFVTWIDSINSGFQNMVVYNPFKMYCQQAADWLSEGGSRERAGNSVERREYEFNEFDRCGENTLYFMDKYLHLKEGSLESGSMKYESKPVHKVMCYLFDCGYSMMMGKPRQIAATSTLAGCALAKILFRKNFFIKMIAQDKEKVIEIFDDKIKHPFFELPHWMRAEVANFRDNLFKLGDKNPKKTSERGVNSKIQVVAPSTSAINGGSPPLVLIDEAGFISILGKMMKEARPTMFMEDPVTKKLVQKRQIIAWGTGGEMDRGGRAYEIEYHACQKNWDERNFTAGIIPLFFDWTTRLGITQEHYDNEKRAYTVEGPERENRMVQFRQHYPTTVEDMFLTSNKTLLSMDWISNQNERIRKLPHNRRAVRGYFEPIYDTNVNSDENSDTPFKIIGAEFIPVDDFDKQGSTWIFMHPEPNWVNRYYGGTDPVMSDNGFSNMSTSIFDAHYKTMSALVDYRDNDHKYTFLQCMLCTLYYKSQTSSSCKELVENNIGTAYIDYKDSKGFYDSLVYRTELPDYMQGGGSVIGIDNRGNRNRFIINKMFELFQAYGDRIYISNYFEQLQTFECTVTEKGNETWGTKDKRSFLDDALFSGTFAYICSLCYEHLPPRKIEHESDKYKFISKQVRGADGMLTRVQVKVPRYG